MTTLGKLCSHDSLLFLLCEPKVRQRAYVHIYPGSTTPVLSSSSRMSHANLAAVSILFSDIIPLRERGTWQGYMNIVFATGFALGGPLGGLMADSIGWRWCEIL
jgi:MFS family permease